MYHLEDQVFGVPSRHVERIEDVESNMREMFTQGAGEYNGESIDYMQSYICVLVNKGDYWDCGCRDFREWLLSQKE